MTDAKLNWERKTDDKTAVDNYVKDNSGVLGTLKVAGGQAADEFFGGIPEAIYDTQADPLDVAKKNALKAAHPNANSVGGIGGFAASLLLPVGLLGKAAKVGTSVARGVEGSIAAESLIGRLGTKALGGAVEGAVGMAPQTLSHIIEGNPDQAGETMLAGAALGALSAPIRLGAEIASPLMSKAANSLAGTSPEAIQEGAQGVVDALSHKVVHKGLAIAGLSHGVPGYLAGEAVGEALSPALKKIAEDYGAAQKLGSFVADQFTKLPKYLENLGAVSEQAGKGYKALSTGASTGGVKLLNQKDWENHVEEVNKVANSEPIKTDSPYEAALNKAQIQKASYLAKQMPAIDLLPKPFQNHSVPLPSKQDRRAYLQKLEIANNPFLILDKVKDGTLNGNHMDALQGVFPNLYSRFIGEIASFGMSKKARKLSKAKRDMLSQFIQVPATNYDPQMIQVAQQVYQPPPQQPEQKKMTLPGTEGTEVQQVAAT